MYGGFFYCRHVTRKVLGQDIAKKKSEDGAKRLSKNVVHTYIESYKKVTKMSDSICCPVD